MSRAVQPCPAAPAAGSFRSWSSWPARARVALATGAVAGCATAAVAIGWLDRPVEIVSPARTTRSLRGELRIGARGLAARVAAAARSGDAVIAWIAQPVLRELLPGGDPVVRALATGPAPPPAVVARGAPAAEARLAEHLDRIGSPLVDAFLATVDDPRADPGARAVLMRVLAHRWPDELAPRLAATLRSERRLVPVAEAAVVAIRVAGAHGDGAFGGGRGAPADELIGALRRAVARLSGWGRQYPILALAALGDRDSVADVRPALDDPEPAVRRHAAMYLGGAGHMAVLEPLHRLARRDPDATTRAVAQHALARLLSVVLPAIAGGPGLHPAAATGPDAVRRHRARARRIEEENRLAFLERSLLPRLAAHRPRVHD
jgi:hypothetical protein